MKLLKLALPALAVVAAFPQLSLEDRVQRNEARKAANWLAKNQKIMAQRQAVAEKQQKFDDNQVAQAAAHEAKQAQDQAKWQIQNNKIMAQRQANLENQQRIEDNQAALAAQVAKNQKSRQDNLDRKQGRQTLKVTNAGLVEALKQDRENLRQTNAGIKDALKADRQDQHTRGNVISDALKNKKQQDKAANAAELWQRKRDRFLSKQQ